jgi:hypothetical protein
MGSSRDERIGQSSDLYAFFIEQLGLPFKPIPVTRQGGR